MKIFAFICNVVLFLFSCMVLAGDGLPTEPVYIFFTWWIHLTMVLNAVLVFLIGKREGWLGFRASGQAPEGKEKTAGRKSISSFLKITAIACNLVFIGFVCWALADQPNHPKEPGFIEYVVMMLLTPILTSAVLFFSGVGECRLRVHMKRKALGKT
jgi:hypothetical protein